MPNIIFNRICVKGASDALEQLVAARGQQPSRHGIDGVPFDFEVLVPVPETLTGDEYVKWLDENWGTRENALGVALKGRPSDGQLLFFIETAWTAPDRWVVEVSRKFPDLEFVHESVDEFEDGAGRTVVVGGEILIGEELDPHGLAWLAEAAADHEDEGNYS